MADVFQFEIDESHPDGNLDPDDNDELDLDDNDVSQSFITQIIKSMSANMLNFLSV